MVNKYTDKADPESGLCSGIQSRANCCSAGGKKSRVCLDGERYVKKQMALPAKVAILSCEGACIKGEVTRVAANILAYRLERDKAVRICLGDASTGNSGMLDLIRRAPGVIALEGCYLHCGTQILKSRDQNIVTLIVDTSALYSFDREKYFEIFDMPRDEIDSLALKVAEAVRERLFANHAGGCGSQEPSPYGSL